MKEEVTLNSKEQRRLLVLNQVESNKLPRLQAVELLDISPRHLKRLLAAYRKKGAAALAHGNRGKRSHNALDERLKEQVLELARGKYTGFNFQHFTDSLAEREGIDISRSSVRRILLNAGIKSPKKRRPPKYRSQRERYPEEGMLLQIDASPHDWLEGRGPSFTLIGAIDDATGKVPYVFFQEQEDSAGYFKLLREIVARYGIPLALYHDRHTIFESPKKELSIEEQLTGKKNLTQFGRLLNELGITSISAKSPQAKGRIERLWGTFQSRLVSELRLAQAKTAEEANKVLADYLPAFNRDFQVIPQEPDLAYRKIGNDFVPDSYFCFKYKRLVGGDNVVKFNGRKLQIMPTKERASYAHARVEVHEKLDGTLAVYYQEQYLVTRPVPTEAKVVVAAQPSSPVMRVKAVPKPAPNHPWHRAVTGFTKQGVPKSLNN